VTYEACMVLGSGKDTMPAKEGLGAFRWHAPDRRILRYNQARSIDHVTHEHSTLWHVRLP
jgi:hypothetical protein